MANKNCTSIPILIGIILIPQLFFWWLAPQNARAFYIAYIGMTLITAGIPVACFLTSRKSCIRRSTGLFIVGSILETIVIGATAWILAVNATLRSALFAYAIMLLAISVIMIPMISAAVKGHGQGILPFDTADRTPEPASQEAQCRNTGSRSLNNAAPRTTNHMQTVPALPPRNR